MKQSFYSLFWCGLALSALLLLSSKVLETNHIISSQTMTWAGISFFGICWISSLVDAFRAKIPRKQFWLTSHFLLPVIAPIIYVSQRKKLLARV